MTRKEKIANTAEGMLGKSFMYGVNVVQVLNYEINEERERFYLWTSRKADPYDRPLNTALEFITSEFREVNNTVTPFPGTNLQVIQQPEDFQMLKTPGLALEVKDILMDNIRKVQTDRNYIPQAEAIRENVDTLIELAKTEIAYVAVMKRRNHNAEEEF